MPKPPPSTYVSLPQYTCGRCGHTWIGKEPVRRPRRCPTCTSPYYDKPHKYHWPTPARWRGPVEEPHA
jgi:hypothetical protein